MADKEKKAASSKKSSDETASEESKAAKKVAKAAKGQGKKSDKPNVFVRMGKSTKRFFKDSKGECKKIVWPDAKTVLKSTGVVLLTVIIVGLLLWGLDTGLTAGIQGLKGVASGEEVTTSVDKDANEDKEDESTSDKKKDETKKSDEDSTEKKSDKETTEKTTSDEEQTTTKKAE